MSPTHTPYPYDVLPVRGVRVAGPRRVLRGLRWLSLVTMLPVVQTADDVVRVMVSAARADAYDPMLIIVGWFFSANAALVVWTWRHPDAPVTFWGAVGLFISVCLRGLLGVVLLTLISAVTL